MVTITSPKVWTDVITSPAGLSIIPFEGAVVFATTIVSTEIMVINFVLQLAVRSLSTMDYGVGLRARV